MYNSSSNSNVISVNKQNKKKLHQKLQKRNGSVSVNKIKTICNLQLQTARQCSEMISTENSRA